QQALLPHVPEPLPARWRVADRLADRGAALAAVHFPELEGDADAGRRRLAYDELALMQLVLLRRRAQRHARAAAARIDGPHALIEDTVRFDRLAVCVIDEQHRFGVRQRAALDAKAGDAGAPHVLHMTATPIPRTLALTTYGDLDVTTLRSLPAGRRPIVT